MNSMRALRFTSIILRLCAINPRAALFMFCEQLRSLRWASCEAHGTLMSEANMTLEGSPKPGVKMMRPVMMKPVKTEETED